MNETRLALRVITYGRVHVLVLSACVLADRQLQLALRVITDGGCTDLKAAGRKDGRMDGIVNDVDSRKDAISNRFLVKCLI